DRRLRQFAGVVAETRAPDRHESLDVRFIDLAQRAILVEMIAHPEGGDIFAVLPVVDQLLRGLCQRAPASGRQCGRKYPRHRGLPVVFRSSATLSEQAYARSRRNRRKMRGCRARAASGHAAAPPSNVMNSRRLTARCLPCTRPKG